MVGEPNQEKDTQAQKERQRAKATRIRTNHLSTRTGGKGKNLTHHTNAGENPHTRRIRTGNRENKRREASKAPGQEYKQGKSAAK